MKRRANNEGSIYQRKDGYWVVAVSVEGKQKPLYCKSEDEAVALLKELHSQQILGKKLFASDEPFGVYLLRWLTKTKISKVRRNTWEDYSALAKNHIIPVIGSMRICDIQTKDVQSLYDGLTAKGSSPEIIRKVHVILGMVFRSMLPDRIIDRDMTVGTSRPSVVTKKRVLFTDEQERIFISVVLGSASQFKAVFQVYYELGGRISETLGLKWSSVHDDYVVIENTVVNVKGGMIESLPKTPGSIRRVFLSDECMKLIKNQHRKPFRSEPDRTILSEFVFATANGKPHSDRNWRRQWDQWLVQAFGSVPIAEGEKPPKYKKPMIVITPHSLRHRQAVHLFQSGWTVADIQIRGGWSSPKVLQEIYAAHSSEDRQRQMAQAAKLQTTVETTVDVEKGPPA